MLRVLKCGGNEIDDPQWLDKLVRLVATLCAAGEPPIIVHGGGKEIGRLQTALGGEPRFVAGLRVTDATALHAATLVLCGSISTRLVAALQLGGVEALGMSGVDRGLVYATRQQHPAGDLGAVGTPQRVRATLLLETLAVGAIPVLAPICLGDAGPLNVNADQFAGAVAAAVGAIETVFISNVPGVLIAGAVAAHLSAAQVQSLIADGTISGGMIPKVESALAALQQGVSRVRITNIDALDGGTEVRGEG